MSPGGGIERYAALWCLWHEMNPYCQSTGFDVDPGFFFSHSRDSARLAGGARRHAAAAYGPHTPAP
eukprot:4745436-Prymnesium_polylepis.1